MAPGRNGCVWRYIHWTPAANACSCSDWNKAAARPRRRYWGSTNSRTTSTILQEELGGEGRGRSSDDDDDDDDELALDAGEEAEARPTGCGRCGKRWSKGTCATAATTAPAASRATSTRLVFSTAGSSSSVSWPSEGKRVRREAFTKAEVSFREVGVAAEMVQGGGVSTVGVFAGRADIGLVGGGLLLHM